MDENVPASLLCSLCDEMCKRGAQMKCCGTRACRACAVLRINKTRRCWNEECGEESITTGTHLKNDDLLRKAVGYFNKNGKMAPAHKKILKKTRNGKGLEKKQIGKDGKKKKIPVNVSNKFNQPCGYGEKCRRKGCLFVHDKPTLGDRKKVAEAKREKYLNKTCSFGAGCTTKSCMCSNQSPSSEAEDRAMSALKVDSDRKPIGSDFGSVLFNGNPMNRGIGAGMGGFRAGGTEEMEREVASMKMSDVAMDDDFGGHNTNLVQMQKMKQELESMMSNAARYGILPSYDHILGVVNGINTAISNN